MEGEEGATAIEHFLGERCQGGWDEGERKRERERQAGRMRRGVYGLVNSGVDYHGCSGRTKVSVCCSDQTSMTTGWRRARGERAGA